MIAFRLGLLVPLFAALPLLAQSTGQIVGTVSDTSGAVIPATSIRVQNELTGLEWTSESDEAGRFIFPRVPTGTFKLTASKDGFRQFVSESFRLDADQSRQVSVTLQVGATNESVTVSGAVSQVDTISATIREVIDQKRIAELPLNGRNPVQLVLLVPGASRAGFRKPEPQQHHRHQRITRHQYQLPAGRRRQQRRAGGRQRRDAESRCARGVQRPHQQLLR
jgi:hypothetical protein